MSHDPRLAVNDAGIEAYRHIVARLAESVGEARTMTTIMASIVCLANALAPAIEAAEDRGKAADDLVSSCTQQLRLMIGPVVNGAE
jgi:hypothetical protein